MINIDIVIPVYNALDCVKECLKSVSDSIVDSINLNVYIVNDCSEKETKEYLEEITLNNNNFFLINNEINLGYTKSLNKGVREGSSEVVIQLNSDCILSKNSIKKIYMNLMGSNYFAISPMSNAASWQSIPKVINDDGSMAVNKLPKGFSIDDMDNFCYVYNKGFVESQLLNGFCVAYKREMLEELGLADEVKFPKGYGEEDDLHLRAANNGFECAIDTSTYVFHQKTKSFSSKQKNELTRQGRFKLNESFGDKRIKSITSGLRFHPKLDYLRLASESIVSANIKPIREFINYSHNSFLKKESTGNYKSIVSVVMPVYRNAQMTSDCIKSLYSSTEHEFELVVVLNGADKDSIEEVYKLKNTYAFKVVDNKENYNFSMGCNLGALECEGDKILFLNNDMLFLKNGWIDSMVEALEDPNIGGSSVKLTYEDGDIQSSGFLWDKESFFPIEPFKNRREINTNGNFYCDGVTGACLMVRAIDFYRLKGFDPIFINGSEDIDLCLKINVFLGKKFCVALDSNAIHLESKSPGRSKHILHNRRVFYRKWAGYISNIASDISLYTGFSDKLPSAISMRKWKHE